MPEIKKTPVAKPNWDIEKTTPEILDGLRQELNNALPHAPGDPALKGRKGPLIEVAIKVEAKEMAARELRANVLRKALKISEKSRTGLLESANKLLESGKADSPEYDALVQRGKVINDRMEFLDQHLQHTLNPSSYVLSKDSTSGAEEAIQEEGLKKVLGEGQSKK